MKIKIEKNNKSISFRNYFIVIFVSILVVAATLYVRSFIMSYRNSITNVSIFSDKVKAIHINDLEYTIPEAGEVILYISYTGNKDISKMESKLYKTIKKKGISDKIIYLDITDMMNDANYVNTLKNMFPNIKEEINIVPLFIYIDEGKPIEAMSSELKMIDYKVLNKLTDKYGIE